MAMGRILDRRHTQVHCYNIQKDHLEPDQEITSSVLGLEAKRESQTL